jgi:hypothetical protein
MRKLQLLSLLGIGLLLAETHGARCGKGASADDKAQAAINKLGGKVNIHDFGGDRRHVYVNFRGTKITDDQLPILKDLKAVDGPDLMDTGITDAGLKHLLRLPQLTELVLDRTAVTDAGVETILNYFGELTVLGVGGTKITDKSFPKLFDRFPSLRITRDKVAEAGKYHVNEESDAKGDTGYMLMLGNTAYAKTFKKPAANNLAVKDRSRLATTYYHVNGPVGQVVNQFQPQSTKAETDFSYDALMAVSLAGLISDVVFSPQTRTTSGLGGQILPAGLLVRVWSEPAFGVLRLNAGTYATYGRPFQFIDFYNSAAEVEEFSLPSKGKPRFFSFIQDARDRGCTVRIFRGDERITLRQKGPRSFYSALFLEVTRNDIQDINTSLLTTEALANSWTPLQPKGWYAFTFHTLFTISRPL